MIGKLNTTKIIKEYEGNNTPTAQTIVDNDKNIIKVNVNETFIDSKIKIDEIKVNGVKQEPINKSIDIQVPEMTSESIKQKYESNPDTNAFTDIDKEKVDKLKIDGDGTKYLNDTGEYKIVEAGIEEAPQDDEIYGRKNKAWVTITGGGSGGGIIMELGEGF